MPSIYTIVDDFYALKNLADETMTDTETGEVRELTDEEKDDFVAWLNENEENLETKFNNIYKVWRNLKAESETAEAEKKALKDEVDRLQKRAKSRLNAADRAKGLIGYALDKLKMKKYKTVLFSAGFQATRKTAKPTEGFFNPDDIPVEYLKRELSSTAINEAVATGRLYEKDDPLSKGSLFYRDENGYEQKLKGVTYTGGETLVIR